MSTTIDSKEDIFQIAAKAQKLLQEILSSNKANNSKNATLQQNEQIVIKQEPTVHHHSPPPSTSNQFNQQPQFYLQQQQQTNQQQFNYYSQQVDNQTYASNLQPQQYILHPPPVVAPHATPPPPTQQNLIISPTFYMQHPPPMLANAPSTATIVQQPYFYPQHQQPLPQARPTYYYTTPYHHQPPPGSTIVQMQQQHHHYYQQQQQQQQQNNPLFSLNTSLPPPVLNSTNLASFRKRRFGELNNFDNNNNINNSRFKATYQAKATPYFTGANSQAASSANLTAASSKTPDDSGQILHEEEDLNLMRERELKELKCKSVVEKMSVFLKYYQQFKDAYIQRVQSLECSDSLKLQFHSLIKFLSEYENLLAELNMMITEHEHNRCKNNHRKTKKFFNKTKAFIRYECNKRLQSNIFEYRRLINSQDRYAGMYDLLDMNSYLISLLPDIGVSIRRYINRCEKAREQEQLEEEEDAEYQQTWYSEENSTDSNELNGKKSGADANDLTIPTFKEYVALNRGEEEDDEEDDEDDEDDEEYDEEDDDDNTDDASKENKKKKRKLSTNESNGAASTSDQPTSNKNRVYESFSKGIDSLNRYLLKRVDEEETLDELVKERIVKWINKRQAKYILIFSEVDKLLNQHKAGECYSKFHSYLLFNLGKLVTVCDSYHQKLKELLYSTTIRRKKKRKKVKLLPESMADVFNEIIDLKKALELAKINIKRCNMMSSNLTASAPTKEKQF